MILRIFQFVEICRNGLQNRRFLEKREAQNLEDFVEAAVRLQFLLYDGHEHVDGDGGPDLGLDRVLRRTVEGLDASRRAGI